MHLKCFLDLGIYLCSEGRTSLNNEFVLLEGVMMIKFARIFHASSLIVVCVHCKGKTSVLGS